MIILTNLCIIIVIFSFAGLILVSFYSFSYSFDCPIVQTNCQTCLGMSQYEQCSTNPVCGCFKMATTNGSGICAFPWLTCSELSACERKHNFCYQPGHVCVHHPRCFTHPICYPLSMSQQQLCPSIPDRPKPGDGICTNAIWAQNSTIVAGGNDLGSELNQLNLPFGIFVDDNQAVYVADFANHRIVKWDRGASSGQLVAGGNGQGNHDDQLSYPNDVVVDQDGTIYISDDYNRRVQRWLPNAANGHTVIRNISIHGLALDDSGTLYVTDPDKGELSKWRRGETVGQVIASGFEHPLNLFVDRNRSIYFVENSKHQVLKIDSETGQITRIAGGSYGNRTDQLAFPNSVIVDQLGTVYVADADNQRIIRWPRGATSGSVIAGGRGRGSQLDQFWSPTDLSFDLDGNLYVVDDNNNRVQKFAIDRSSC